MGTAMSSTAAEQLTAMIREFLQRFQPFNRMEPEAITFLAARLKVAYYPRGSEILTPEMGPPDFCHIVARGQIQARQAGTTAVTEYAMIPLDPGDIFPIGSIAAQRPSTNTYTAVEDSFVYQLAADDFLKLMLMSTVLHLYCTQYIADLLVQSRQQLQSTFSQRAAEQQTMITPLGELLKREPVFVSPDTQTRSALEMMASIHTSCMMVADEEQRPLGILTQSDILPRIVIPGFDLENPISAVMTPKPYTLPATASAYDATLEMAAHKLRHMLVVDHHGKLLGVISERDLFSLQRISLRQVRATIEGASNIEALQRASMDIRHLALSLVAQGIAAEQLTRFISSLNDALTRRIIDIEIDQHELHDLEYAWLAFGSEGRHEQTLSTDQDNGLIYVCPDNADKSALKARLLIFAQDVNERLADCGFPLCNGNIMASNPELCLTYEEWQHRFADWMHEPAPQALLNASIFFDFRVLSGNEQFGDSLRIWLNHTASKNGRFLMMMADNALQTSPPLGLIRDFVLERDGSIDLKKSGARLFVDVARILALRTEVSSSSTVQRLRQAGPRIGLQPDDLSAIVDGFNFIQLLRLRSQHLDTEHGAPGDNKINPNKLNEIDRRILKEAFRQARKLQLRLKLDYQL